MAGKDIACQMMINRPGCARLYRYAEKATFPQRLKGSERERCDYPGEGGPGRRRRPVQRPRGVDEPGRLAQWRRSRAACNRVRRMSRGR